MSDGSPDVTPEMDLSQQIEQLHALYKVVDHRHALSIYFI